MPAAAKSGRGDFFGVNAGVWAAVAALGMNAMVAFLILARGTGGDQVTTSWSVNAIEAYTGISRPLAKTAIKALGAAGLLEHVKGGTHPKYRIATTSPNLAKVTEKIWLPNSLVDGVPGNAASPIELIRQCQNPEVMQLFVMLYGVHDLAAFGGVYWRIARTNFGRERAGEWRENAVWKFSHSCVREYFPAATFFVPFAAGRKTPVWRERFWTTLNMLENLRLVEFVAHVIEADTDQAAMIHPFGWNNGEHAERRLAVATNREGMAMLGMDPDDVQPGVVFVPAKKHLTEIAMVGLLRLRYKPHTAATARWIARMDEWEALAESRDSGAESCDRRPMRAA